MELYLIRHGQTVWNAAGKLQGSCDIELNSFGRQAAGELGQKLDSTEFDLIFSSPLIRAFETACLIRGHRNIQIIRDERLKEISFGVNEGSDYKMWIAKDSPYRFFFSETEKYVPPEQGESFEQVCLRTKDFAKDKLEGLFGKAERVMVVAHGTSNAALMCYLENRTTADFWGKGLQKNCEASIFEYNGSLWQRKPLN